MTVLIVAVLAAIGSTYSFIALRAAARRYDHDDWSRL